MVADRRNMLQQRTRYQPADVEPRIFAQWQQAGVFHPEPKRNASVSGYLIVRGSGESPSGLDDVGFEWRYAGLTPWSELPAIGAPVSDRTCQTNRWLTREQRGQRRYCTRRSFSGI